MALDRRTVLRTGATVPVVVGLAGCSAAFDRFGSGSGSASFDATHETTDDWLDTLTITHVGGEDLPASDVYLSGIAFDWPPARTQGFTYSWAAMADLDPDVGIADRSVDVHPALVDAVRVLWKDGDEAVVLDEFPVIECGDEIACFDYIYQGADDALDRLTVRHVAGRDLAAEDVYITASADAYPPDPDKGEPAAWYQLSDVGWTEGIAGRSLRTTIARVDSACVLWRHDRGEVVLDEFQL